MSIFKRIYESFAFKSNLLKASNFLYFTKTNPKALELKTNDKCLLLAPHPDDETFGCGGLLIKYPDNFHIVCLTNGIHGNFDENPNHNELKENRESEFKSALEIAGVKSYEFLEIEDRKLIKNHAKFQNINLKDYDSIFIPYFMDNHKDHKAVKVLLQKSLRESSYKKDCKIVFYEIWATLPQFNYFTDITAIRKTKEQMINCYPSQLKNLDFLEGIMGLNKYRGTCVNLGYAEAFSIIDIGTFMKL